MATFYRILLLLSGKSSGNFGGEQRSTLRSHYEEDVVREARVMGNFLTSAMLRIYLLLFSEQRPRTALGRHVKTLTRFRLS